MTGIIENAASSTSLILQHADRAAALTRSGGENRVNGIGVLRNPHWYLAELKAARDELDKAIALHEATAWPNESDYRAL